MKRYHYVYRITNKVENKHYYGSRSSNVPPIEDIGKKYFSSSSDTQFMNEQRETPDIFKYKVVRTFSSRKQADQFEILLLKKFEVNKNENFYNLAIYTGNIAKTIKSRSGKTYEEIFGYEKAQEIKQKQSKPKPQYFGKLVSKMYSGVPLQERYGCEEKARKAIEQMFQGRTSEWREKLSLQRRGVPLSEEQKLAISKGGQKRWDNMSDEDRQQFCDKMTEMNQCPKLREVHRKNTSQLWQDPQYLEKMKNRKHKPKMVIEIFKNEKPFLCYIGFEDMLVDLNLSKPAVKESMKTGQSIKGTKKYPNMEGLRFRKMQKQEYEKYEN